MKKKTILIQNVPYFVPYIAKNIEFLLHKEKMKQSDLGELLDKKSNVISQWTKKVSVPKVRDIQKICDYFNISIDDFINKKLEDVKEVTGSTLQEPAAEYPIIEREAADLKRQLVDKEKIILLLERENSYLRSITNNKGKTG